MTHGVRLKAREEDVVVHDRDLAPAGGGEPKIELMLLSERRMETLKHSLPLACRRR
jgi:hypothetical protein